MIKQSPILIIILLVINITSGLILSCYPLFNMLLNCAVLCVALVFVFWINKKKIAPVFRMSLAFSLPAITFIELLIGCFSPNQFKDNWGIIAILCCMAFEFLLTYSVIRKSTITNHINNESTYL